jgi:hypothetical protein
MEILALGGLIVAALMVFAVFGLAIALIKGLVLLILLPFRLVFGLLLLPFRLIGGLIGLMVLPALAVVAIVLAAVGGLLVLFVPLLPLALAVGLIWLLFKSSTKPAAA